MDKTRKIFILMILSAIGLTILAFFVGRETNPIAQQMEGVGLFLLKGKITQIESFQRTKGDGTVSHKFLIEVQAEEIEQLQGSMIGDDLPEPGDYVRFDSPDSRVNLLVESVPSCDNENNPTATVVVCEYNVVVDDGSFVIMETIGTTGLPEYVGTTK